VKARQQKRQKQDRPKRAYERARFDWKRVLIDEPLQQLRKTPEHLRD